MAAMFDGLLQLNRAQRHVLQPQPVDLQALLGGLRQRLQAARKAEASSGVCLLQRPCCRPIRICWSRL
jgi:hypothetical protein